MNCPKCDQPFEEVDLDWDFSKNEDGEDGIDMSIICRNCDAEFVSWIDKDVLWEI